MIAEGLNSATELMIVDMLHYSLEHADHNLPYKNWITDKVRPLPLWLYIYIYIWDDRIVLAFELLYFMKHKFL